MPYIFSSKLLFVQFYIDFISSKGIILFDSSFINYQLLYLKKSHQVFNLLLDS